MGMPSKEKDVTENVIEAPKEERMLLTVTLLNGNINTEVFVTWVEQDIIPKLPPESVLVIDDANFHKAPRTRQLLEASGHFLECLPPYSPDLNPIEKK